MKRRKAAVAGSFYPDSKSELIQILKDSFSNKTYGPGEEFKTLRNKERTVIGGISPHAGYFYSGCAAAHTYLKVFQEKIPETVVVLGTDHIGYNKIALMKEGSWETPLGDISIDGELAKQILDVSEIILPDDSAFMGYPFGREHNIEVQLPFIKYCAGENDVKFLPIKISQKNFEVLDTISTDLSKAIHDTDKDITIIASSDMTHKQPRNIMNPNNDLDDMRKMDQEVINAFVDMDPKKTLSVAQTTSVCGPQTITTLLLTCKKLGAKHAKALRYYTSYDKSGGSGPCNYSVGYFSGIISLN